jgi:hypothetical protein
MKLSFSMILAALMATTVSAGYKISYDVVKDAACRTDKGENGADGEEYKLLTANSGTYEDCKDSCTEKSWCKGFEYYFTAGRCELWKENFAGEEEDEEKENFTCAWKVYH